MNRVLPLMILLVAAGLTGWWILRDEGPGDSAEAATAESSSSSEVNPGAGEASPASDQETRPAIETSRFPGAPAGGDAESQTALAVRVRSAIDGRPVEGASVSWRAPRGGTAAATTDARGTCRLRPPPGPVVIEAVAGSLSARQEIGEKRPEQVTLMVAPRGAITVTVRGPAGGVRPGVSLQFVLRQGVKRFAVLERITDVEGQVTLPRGELLGRAIGLRMINALTAPGLWLEAGGLFADPPRLELDPEHLEDEIDLVIPDTGAVEVTIVDDSEGRSPGRRLRVEARIAGREAPDITRRTRDRVVRLEPVEVGLQLEVTARITRRGLLPVTRRLEGPLRPDELVRVQLVLGEPARIVTARLVDGEGKALGPRWFDAILDLGPGDQNPHKRTLGTDRQGRFRYTVDAPWREGTQRRLVVYDTSMVIPKPHGPEHLAVLDLARSFPAGTTDLGDLVMRPAPLIVSGRIVDAEGHGIAVAQVHVSGFVRRIVSRMVGAISVPEVLQGDVVVSGPDGRFRLRGLRAAPHVDLTVEAPGRERVRKGRVAVGTEGLRIVLAPAGAVAGSLLLPPGVEGRDLDLAVAPVADPTAPRTVSAEWTDAAFRIDGLASGHWILSLRIAGESRVVHTSGTLAIRAGATTALEPVDLRRAIRRFVVSVEDPGGLPLGDVEISARSSDDEPWRALGRTTSDGRFRGITSAPRQRLRLTRPGFVEKRVQETGAVTSVSLMRR